MRSTWIWVLIAALITGAAAWHISGLLAPANPPAVTGYGKADIGGVFALTDQKGTPATNETLKGKWLLVYFGFTHCPDICPTGLLTISNALDAIGKTASRIQPVFISVDPERDTPEVIAPYVANFHPSMIGLTGSAEQVAQAAKAYKVYFSKVEQPESAMKYTIDHSAFIYLMDPEGNYTAHFPYNVSQSTLVNHLQKVLE